MKKNNLLTKKSEREILSILDSILNKKLIFINNYEINSLSFNLDKNSSDCWKDMIRQTIIGKSNIFVRFHLLKSDKM